MFDKIKLLLRTSRPITWGLVFIYFAGFYDSKGQISLEFILQTLSFTFPITLFAGGVNDVYDYDSDKVNPRKLSKKSLIGKVLKPKNRRFIIKSGLISAAIIFLVSLFTKNLVNTISVSTLLISMYTYSAPPRLKNYPPMDLVCNLLLFLTLYICGYSVGDPNLSTLRDNNLINLITWSLGVVGFTTLANMTDYESDKKANIKNTVVRYGLRLNSIIVFSCFLLASIWVNLDFAPMQYYIYGITAFYSTLILLPTQKYSKIAFYLTITTYAPILVWYIYFLSQTN